MNLLLAEDAKVWKLDEARMVRLKEWLADQKLLPPRVGYHSVGVGS